MAAPSSTRPWSTAVAVATAWYALGVAGLLADSGVPMIGHDRAIAVLAGASLLFGLWVWWRHGGPAITAVGVYNFAFALFVGFAGLYLLSTGTVDGSMVRALAWCYFGQVTTWLLFWSRPPAPEPAGPRPVDSALLRQATVAGVLVAGGSGTALALFGFGGTPRHVVQACGFVGALLIAIGLLSDGRRRPLAGLVLTAAAFALSVATSNSYGRLMLGSLGLALMVVVSRRLRTRAVKLAVVAGAAPVLWMFAIMRKDALLEQHPGLRMDGTGLESVASPLRVFAVLLDYNDLGLFAPAWGHTFGAALISLLPRAVWPGKPQGFGAELVPLVNPELVNSGHSDAALFQGEWLFNFGVAGLILMVPAVGLAVAAVDRFLWATAVRPLVGRGALLAYATAIVVAAGLPDLAWGTFTFTARAGMRLAALVLVWLLLTDRRIKWHGQPCLPSGTPGRYSRTPGGIPPTRAGSSAASPGRSASSSGAASAAGP